MGKLVLCRNYGESIKIGEDITITLLGDFKGQVRVTIEAPNDVKIHRSEFYDKISKFKDKKMTNKLTGETKSWDEWFSDYKAFRDSGGLDVWYGYCCDPKSGKIYPENWWEADFLEIVE